MAKRGGKYGWRGRRIWLKGEENTVEGGDKHGQELIRASLIPFYELLG
jgi:hypothetical protein